MAHADNPSAGKAEVGGPSGSLASMSNIIGEIQVNERPVSEEIMGFLRMTPYIALWPTHTNTQTHLHTIHMHIHTNRYTSGMILLLQLYKNVNFKNFSKSKVFIN